MNIVNNLNQIKLSTECEDTSMYCDAWISIEVSP